MKPGRNDPCYCGSGKKYKRCCIDNVSRQQAQVFDDINALAMNPHLTLDEMNSVLQHKVEKRNNLPEPDFCGLSPTQMANWLYAPFDDLQWVTFGTPEDLSSSPVMRYLTLILDEAMQNNGAFKATSKGNLPAALVQKASNLLPDLAVSEFEDTIEFSEFTGSREDRFNALHYTRVLAEIAGIIYYRNGSYHIKKDAQQQYKKQWPEAFFKPMLKAALYEYNWGYFDSFEQDVDLHTCWLFMLWRIQSHCNVEQLVDEMMKAFPDLLLALPTDHYFSPEEQLSFLIESRFIERFLQFWGFATIDPRRYLNREPVARIAQIQPLLGQTFQFSVKA